MKPLILLAAIAAAALVLRRRHAPATPDADDGEVVGMPTTWVDVSFPGSTSWTLGPGWYVEFAPTSQN